MAESDIFWDQLIELIEEGRVVPVVGQDLLTIPANGGQGLLYPYLADRLADYFKVSRNDLPPGGALNEVACRYLAQSGDHSVQRVYTLLRKVASEVEAWPVPEPLLKLAAIQPFQLFVTTTFDSFLAHALDQVRFRGDRRTRVLAFSPLKKEDLPAEPESDHVPTVYHLLGKLSVTPTYAVTQWDLVEFFHELQSETRRPHLLFDELNRQSLLIIGSHLGGWLARFFMRMAKGHFASGIQGADYVADAQIGSDTHLVLFFRRFNPSIEIFSEGGAVKFVDELYRRWLAAHPPEVHAADASRPLHAPVTRISSGAVFLSYAAEDRPAVERIKNALETSGIDVFFDKEGLHAGDVWENKLRLKIHECSLFVPIISQHTLTPERRFFRVEWNLAIRECESAPFSNEDSFLLPVVVDGTVPEAPGVPERFRAVQWERLPGGETTPDFVARIQQLYRRYQKPLAAGAR